MKQNLRIGMVAGEVSGDMLGASLMDAITRKHPQTQFMGIGGPRMLARGFQSQVAMDRLSVMGFIEPLGRLPELLRIKRNLQDYFIHSPPDVFIGIDSPGFNLRVEKVLHSHGIRTVHYVSPSVWAWGEKRIHDIAKAVDLVLALLPFETAIYQRHGIGVRFVGHPLADQIDPHSDDLQEKAAARQALNLATDVPVLALMPGSRRDEIKRLGKLFIETANVCLAQNPQWQFVLPCANAERKKQLTELLGEQATDSRFHIFEGNSHTAMKAADLILLASGTATLEALLLKRPMIVCYRLAPLTYAIASRLLTVESVSLPNLLAGAKIVPEFLQGAATVEALSAAVTELHADKAGREVLLQRFAAIHQQIRCDASSQAADAVLELIARETL